jgi:hypothetical protein
MTPVVEEEALAPRNCCKKYCCMSEMVAVGQRRLSDLSYFGDADSPSSLYVAQLFHWLKYQSSSLQIADIASTFFNLKQVFVGHGRTLALRRPLILAEERR